MARIVNFFDGAQSETTPVIGNIVASDLVRYPDDATYEATEQGAPDGGNIYFNTTDNTIRYYNGTAWQELIDENTTQAVENKAIDADNNFITNIDNNEIKPLAGIEATKLADGSVSDTELQYINSVTSNVQDQIDSKQSISEKGVANGYASLDGTGKVPASELPSYVDDVEEYADFASLPGTGETGKIYITLDDNKTFRWTSTVYVQVGPDGGNSWSDLVDADIIPDGPGRDVGSLAQPFNQVTSDIFYAEDASLSTRNNNLAINGANLRTESTTVPMTVETIGDNTADSNATEAVYILTGNKTAGTGDSGNIVAQTGSSVGGSRGQIVLKDGTEGTSGHVWTSTGVNGEGSWSAPGTAGSGQLLSKQVFTTSGTWNKPVGVNTVVVEVLGAGGAGGTPSNTTAGQFSPTTGGGGGGYCKKLIDVTATTSETITIGAGGVAPGSAGSGSAGGTSSFGAICSATGGAGGLSGTASTGVRAFGASSLGGVGAGGDINASGGSSGTAYSSGGAGFAIGSRGGDSIYGGGGRERATASLALAGINGSDYGGGGGGGVNGSGGNTALAGGDGADGIIIVWEYS